MNDDAIRKALIDQIFKIYASNVRRDGIIMAKYLFDEYLEERDSEVKELKEKLKVIKEALKGIYDSRGELDKMNCKIMRVPRIMEDIKNG